MGNIFKFAIKTMRKWTYQIGNQSKIILQCRDLIIVQCVGRIFGPFHIQRIFDYYYFAFVCGSIDYIIFTKMSIIVFVTRAEFLRNHQIQKIEK